MCCYYLPESSFVLSESKPDNRLAKVRLNFSGVRASRAMLPKLVVEKKTTNIVMSQNGAFHQSLINQNAIVYKKMDKIRSEKTKSIKPQPCFIHKTTIKTTELPNHKPGIRSNTLFSSHNWGNK